MRIAVLAPRMHVRGPLQKLVPLLVDALGRLGCEVEVIPWGRRTEGERLPAKVLGRLGDVLAARRRITRGKFPVVVVNTAHDWLTLTRDIVLLSTLRGRRTVVLHFHGSQSPRLVAPGSWLFKRATGLLLARADGVLVLSREEQRQFQVFRPGSRVFVVRNPVPIPQTTSGASPPNRVPTILCVSRLIAVKGIFELVRALPLVQRTTQCRLVLAGEGPEAESVVTLAVELGVRDSVELPGYVEGPELAGLYHGSDVFALPTSHDEGFPTVVLEAMAAGLPIVTTRLRGAADHLVEERNALFVPPNDVEALAAALARLLGSPDLRAGMGAANREKVREFDADSVAVDYLAALESVAAGDR